ncbi:uncharacterized protein LOC141639699 [Silene latifolia]|uniref:uncharacterized protein LOC141639699 n=1 Tax=Silene latifolia TaxID=37657 RepID=UPI003D76DF3C
MANTVSMVDKGGGGRLLPLMGSIGVWNIRGLNSLNKQKDIKWCLHQANVDLSRVRPGSLNKVVHSLCGGWNYITNHQYHDGGRIRLLWKEEKYNVIVINIDAQFIHIKVKDLITIVEFYATYVYWFNRIEDRVPLWNALLRLAVLDPWILLGYFNNVLHIDEKIGLHVRDIDIITFQNTIDSCGLQDMKYHYAHYVPEGDYDHCPCFIQSGDTKLKKKRPFKFYNMWTWVPVDTQWPVTTDRQAASRPQAGLWPMSTVPDFKKIVEDGWINHIQGTLMYKVKQLQNDPHNRSLMDLYQTLTKAKIDFLRQKAKCEWAKDGDANTTMFHMAIKQRQLNNKVLQIEDA